MVGVYAPALDAGFASDDFIEVGARHFDAVDSLQTDDWRLWGERFVKRTLIDPVTDLEILRPTRQVVFWSDYMMWNLNPFGYHLTNLLFHLCTATVVGLLAWRLTRQHMAALAAALFFALIPVATGAVADIASRGHVLAGLFVGLTVLFYILPRRRSNILWSWGMYLLALGSKETAVCVPFILLAYELLCCRDQIRRAPRAALLRQLPFWLITLSYMGLRLVLFGRLSGSPYAIGSWEWTYQVQGYSLYVLAPFILDINEIQTIIFLSALAIIGVLYRNRCAVVFGLVWVPLSLAGTITSPPHERYLYTALIGLALVFGNIAAQPLKRLDSRASAVTLALAGVLLVVYGAASYERNLEYRNAGHIVAGIIRQVKELHPTLPKNSRLVFVGVPEFIRHGYLWHAPLQAQYALQMAYGDQTLRATTAHAFPPVFDDLDRTYFFEYDRRKITERVDLVAALRARESCQENGERAISWSFDEGTEGWEAWNGIGQFEAREGSLYVETINDDPFIGGPWVNVRPNDIERIEIRLRARADAPRQRGDLFWQTAGMADFSPEARARFRYDADGNVQMITLRLPVQGSAPVVRLRLDPAERAGVQIEVEEIRLVCR